MSSKPKKRYMVTLKNSADTNAEQVVHQLTQKGFNTVENLSMLNCLLGEYAGQPADLKNVPGVAAVEEEQSMSSQ